MKDALTALLIQKTEESRRNALREIEKWHRSLDLVTEAALEAECDLNLPFNLTVPLSNAAEEISVVNHIGALEVANLALKKNKQVITEAERQLKEMIDLRIEAKSKALQEINQISSERDFMTAKAIEQKSAFELQAAIDSIRETGESPDFGVSFLKGLVLSFILLLVYFMIQAQLKGLNLMATFWGPIVLIISIFSGLPTHLLRYIFWCQKKDRALKKKSTSIEMTRIKFAQQEVIAEEQQRQRCEILQKTVVNSEKLRHNAETALNLLNAKASTESIES